VHVEFAVILLFSIATAVAIAVRALKLPYTVALVLVGIALGPTRLIDGSLLRRDVLFSLFLPGLVFEAAYHLDLQHVRRQATAIFALAIPGVVVGMAVTTSLLVIFTRALGPDSIALGTALIFSAVVGATDPIAVVAMFRDLGVPRALRVLVEGESLVNDATAIVLFSLAVAWVPGGASGWTQALLDFARVLGAGVAIGAAVGGITSAISRRIDDAMIEITLTVIAAYGSFAFAEYVGASGVIASVVAGVIAGSYAEAGMCDRTRHAVGSFWEYVAFALNSLVFLLMGFSVHMPTLVGSWRAIAVAYGVSLVARLVVVATVKLVLPKRAGSPSWSWTAVLAWGGVRGALSIVLALSLPLGFPQRDAIVAMTYGVVLASLVVQGLSIGRLARALGLVEAGEASLSGAT
jgi:CPA1 family monovalent cation:H+ antiporter